MNCRKKIILGSASPRRKELLQQLGWEFDVILSDCRETITEKRPSRIVCELSEQKAESVWEKLPDEEKPDCLVLGADTIVVQDQLIFGKPGTKERAVKMLKLLSGRAHQVFTGVTMIWMDGEEVRTQTFYDMTEVKVAPMTAAEIQDYAEKETCLDKAGAYGIQTEFAAYVTEICGDYSNVVGLPLAALYANMKRCGLIDTGASSATAVYGSGKVRGVIFDLDGTLADTLESIAYCGNYAMRSCKLPDIPFEKYRYFVGEGADTLIKRCLIYSGDEDLKFYEKAYAKYQIIFKEECLFNVTVYPGMMETLQELKANDIRLAVLSNKPHERTLDVIYSLFGRDLFDTVLGHRQGIAKKPSPQGIQEILKDWEMDAKDVLYVGDTATDMITGNAAGTTTVGVLWGFRDRAELEKHRAQKIIERPEELLELL